MQQRTTRHPEVTQVEIIGGPEAVEVQLHQPDPGWPLVYAEHARRIRAAVSGIQVEIEHIGSTALAGLAAKPIVDLVVAVPDITAEDDYLPALLRCGYELRVREPGHRLVRTPARNVYVHIYQQGHPAIAGYLLLRDRLRTDPADRVRYEHIKRALLARPWSDMNDYAAAKTDVIDEIKHRAAEAGASEVLTQVLRDVSGRASGCWNP